MTEYKKARFLFYSLLLVQECGKAWYCKMLVHALLGSSSIHIVSQITSLGLSWYSLNPFRNKNKYAPSSNKKRQPMRCNGHEKKEG